MMRNLRIGDRMIGDGAPVLVIAEAGVNHNGSADRAHALIDAAAGAAADIVKFQSFVTDELVVPEAPKAPYQQENTGVGGSQYEMLQGLELSHDAQRDLLAHCRERGIMFLSTPYDRPSADWLETIGTPGYKVASTDATNIPFLRHLARKKRPIILSTGMCDLGEVEAAVRAIRQEGLTDLALLHCTSEYPAPLEESNLRAMATLSSAFDCPVGFSDHTIGCVAAVAAVAFGACILERHFTISRNLPGPDHAASLEPHELAEYVRIIRQVEAAAGTGIKEPAPSERANKAVMQKSIVARCAIAAGEVIKADALTCKRPANGLAPRLMDDIVGKRAARPIPANSVITFDAVAWD